MGREQGTVEVAVDALGETRPHIANDMSQSLLDEVVQSED